MHENVTAYTGCKRWVCCALVGAVAVVARVSEVEVALSGLVLVEESSAWGSHPSHETYSISTDASRQTLPAEITDVATTTGSRYLNALRMQVSSDAIRQFEIHAG